MKRSIHTNSVGIDLWGTGTRASWTVNCRRVVCVVDMRFTSLAPKVECRAGLGPKRCHVRKSASASRARCPAINPAPNSQNGQARGRKWGKACFGVSVPVTCVSSSPPAESRGVHLPNLDHLHAKSFGWNNPKTSLLISSQTFPKFQDRVRISRRKNILAHRRTSIASTIVLGSHQSSI